MEKVQVPDWWIRRKENKSEPEDAEYNPRIHCCPRYWKDFCDCVTEFRKQEKEAQVNFGLDFLKSNNIEFEYSNVPNIVKVTSRNGSTANVSLKSIGRWGLIKCRFDNSATWYGYSRKKFIETFKKSEE
jgi:hypothetical protein